MDTLSLKSYNINKSNIDNENDLIKYRNINSQ